MNGLNMKPMAPDIPCNIYGYMGMKDFIIPINNQNINENLIGGYGNKRKDEQYVNLKINGRLFPTWILANFSRYKLPEIFLDGSDPCNNIKMSAELRKYQEFLGKYLDYNSPYRDILIYHGLGSV